MNTKTGLGDLVLISLEKAADGYVKAQDYAYNSGAYFHNHSRPVKKNSISQALKRLREKGLIDFVDDERLLIRITEAGRDKILQQKISIKNQKWDGKWRIVSFDIPEKRRSVRDLLRHYLKNWGFEQWQKSLWVSKKDCTKELRHFIKQIGVERWVVVIESDNVK